ncbi:chitin-binding domain-containing protein [Aquicoccus sp. G2-2]|jgi:hypothetical protein|nr:chitin-binding domain-containing protein [Aquicoccus sp. G2-2]MEA1113477.1 chitin-binding domain-containing protein [Aquicoccus sp. G2-2]
MTFRIALIALLLAPSLAIACERHDAQAMSCADGTVYDATAGGCVPQASS